AMFLLSLNAGFGNTDLSSLPVSAVNLKTGMVEFDRPKTGVDRRCPLWPETIEDLKKAIESRDATSELLFLTPGGKPMLRENYNEDGTLISNTDAIGVMFGKLLKE